MGTFSEELVSIELCNNSLQDLIANRRKHLLIILKPKTLKDMGQT
jgi:hypothetical protein